MLFVIRFFRLVFPLEQKGVNFSPERHFRRTYLEAVERVATLSSLGTAAAAAVLMLLLMMMMMGLAQQTLELLISLVVI